MARDGFPQRPIRCKKPSVALGLVLTANIADLLLSHSRHDPFPCFVLEALLHRLLNPLGTGLRAVGRLDLFDQAHGELNSSITYRFVIHR